MWKKSITTPRSSASTASESDAPVPDGSRAISLSSSSKYLMHYFSRLVASASLILTITGVAWADDAQTTPLTAIAEHHCPNEWSNLVAMQAPTSITTAPPIEDDSTLDLATKNAFNRYVAAVAAGAEYAGLLMHLASSPTTTKQEFERARARFDLAMCLTPTQRERDLITVWSMNRSSRSEAETRKTLFGHFDDFSCMKMDVASRKIFDLDPAAPNFKDQAADILVRTLRACSDG